MQVFPKSVVLCCSQRVLVLLFSFYVIVKTRWRPRSGWTFQGHDVIVSFEWLNVSLPYLVVDSVCIDMKHKRHCCVESWCSRHFEVSCLQLPSPKLFHFRHWLGTYSPYCYIVEWLYESWSLLSEDCFSFPLTFYYNTFGRPLKARNLTDRQGGWTSYLVNNIVSLSGIF